MFKYTSFVPLNQPFLPIDLQALCCYAVGMERLLPPAAWNIDTKAPKPNEIRWFTTAENKFWLSGLKKTQANKFLKTVAMLDAVGLTVMAYRNERKVVCLKVLRVYEGKIVSILHFDPSANRLGTADNLIFSKRLDMPAKNSNKLYDGDLLPIAKLTAMVYHIISAESKGGTVLPLDEAKRLGPLLFIYSLEEARSLYEAGLDLVDVYPLFKMGVSFEEMKASMEIPKTYLEYLYASDAKPEPITDLVNFPEPARYDRFA